jgi:hypothetical protein
MWFLFYWFLFGFFAALLPHNIQSNPRANYRTTHKIPETLHSIFHAMAFFAAFKEKFA